MRHNSLEAEALSRLNTFVTTIVGSNLRLRDTSVVRALKLASDIVGIDISAEVNAALTKQLSERSFSRAVRPGDHQ